MGPHVVERPASTYEGSGRAYFIHFAAGWGSTTLIELLLAKFGESVTPEQKRAEPVQMWPRLGRRQRLSSG